MCFCVRIFLWIGVWAVFLRNILFQAAFDQSEQVRWRFREYLEKLTVNKRQKVKKRVLWAIVRCYAILPVGDDIWIRSPWAPIHAEPAKAPDKADTISRIHASACSAN
jgi:hypothetical protein